MIVITRSLAKKLKTVLRLGLNLSGRQNLPIIQLDSGSHGLRVRCGNGKAAVEFLLAGEQPKETIFVPFELLADIEGGRPTSVEIRRQDGKITASWRDGNVPQFVQLDSPEVHAENWPPMPDQMTENSPELLAALRDASQTTEANSARYALGFVQLDGDRGNIVATDGRQALVQSGFSFPWDDKLLVPPSKVFGSKHLPTDQPVLIGRVEGWFVFRVGPWCFWNWVNSEGRFPDVVSQIGQPERAIASCTIDESDRKFLLDNLHRLPGDDEFNQPATVDLNGHIAVRSQEGDPPSCTELVLSASTRSGEPIRINTNRHFLHRAVQLGFDKVYLFSDSSPALACDERRKFFWALLDAKSAIAPDEKAVRIESITKVKSVKCLANPTPRRLKIMPESIPATNGHSRPNEPTELAGESISVLIEKGEVLRTNLRETLSQTAELIAGLKTHRKRTKRMRSTLLSLRQLQATDA